MYAYVCGHTARFLYVALPGVAVPPATAGDVIQVDVENLRRRRRFYALLQGYDRRVQPQLQNGVNVPSGFLFQRNQRLFTFSKID